MQVLIPWAVALLVGFPAFLCFLGALWAGWQRLPLYVRGRRATATVLARRDTVEEFEFEYQYEYDLTELELPPHSTHVIAVERGRMRIRFKDEEGHEHRILYPDNSQRGRRIQITSGGVCKHYRVGDQVEIRYLPESPRFCFIDNALEIWGPVLTMAVCSAGVLALCVVGLLFGTVE